MLLISVFILCAKLAESLDEGDSCNFMNGTTGTCAKLDNCQSVLQGLQTGIAPDVTCGYTGFTPIVCCPRNTSNDATTSFSVQSDDVRGAIARQKCMEYSQYVHTLKRVPSLNTGHEFRNVSECAIKSNFLFGNNKNADRKEFPYMAAVGHVLETGDIGWHCGGTLISEIFVLTAAHCTHSAEWGDATWVRVGDLDLMRSDDGAEPQDRRVTERIRHPEFKPPSQYHDIALLRLETRVPFNGWIRPACLHTAPLTRTHSALVTGWGREPGQDDEGVSRRVRMARLRLVDPQTCNANWTSGTMNANLPHGVVGNWSICVSAENENACEVDAGGPAVIFSEPEYYCMYDVVGVTAHGKLCNGRNPGIYSRVYYYLRWIESTVWGQE